MAADGESVVGRVDDQRTVLQAQATHRLQQAPDMAVERRDDGVVFMQVPADVGFAARERRQALVVHAQIAVVERVQRKEVARQRQLGLVIAFPVWGGRFLRGVFWVTWRL